MLILSKESQNILVLLIYIYTSVELFGLFLPRRCAIADSPTLPIMGFGDAAFKALNVASAAL